jgi:hypothetical protein
MQRALDIAERHSGAADPHRAVMAVRYAEFLRRIGEADAALALCDSIAGALQSRPMQQSRLLRLRAQMLADADRHAEARDAFDAARVLLEGADGDLRDERARLQLALADASIRAGRWREARAAAVAAHAQFDGRARQPADIHAELMRIDARLAVHDDDVQGATNLLDSAIGTLTAVTGSDTVEIARLEFELAEVLDRIPLRTAEAGKLRAASHARLTRLGVTPAWARS